MEKTVWSKELFCALFAPIFVTSGLEMKEWMFKFLNEGSNVLIVVGICPDLILKTARWFRLEDSNENSRNPEIF